MTGRVQLPPRLPQTPYHPLQGCSGGSNYWAYRQRAASDPFHWHDNKQGHGKKCSTHPTITSTLLSSSIESNHCCHRNVKTTSSLERSDDAAAYPLPCLLDHLVAKQKQSQVPSKPPPSSSEPCIECLLLSSKCPCLFKPLKWPPETEPISPLPSSVVQYVKHAIPVAQPVEANAASPNKAEDARPSIRFEGQSSYDLSYKAPSPSSYPSSPEKANPSEAAAAPYTPKRIPFAGTTTSSDVFKAPPPEAYHSNHRHPSPAPSSATPDHNPRVKFEGTTTNRDTYKAHPLPSNDSPVAGHSNQPDGVE